MAFKDKFIDLHVHTKYTKNNGITEIGELIAKVKEYNMSAVAIVDSGNLSGVPEFYQQCVLNNIKPIIGLGFYFTKCSRFTEDDEKYHLVLLAENNTGLKNLVTLARLSFEEGFYKRPRIDFELLEKYNDGLICLTGGLGGLVDKYLLRQNLSDAIIFINRFKYIFGKENFFLELQDNGLEKNKLSNTKLVEMSKATGVNCVVSGGSFYLSKKDAKKCNDLREENGNSPLFGDGYHFKSQQEILDNFAPYKEVIANTVYIANRCRISLDIEKLKEIPLTDDFEIIKELEKIV